jgi:hypothetical protein
MKALIAHIIVRYDFRFEERGAGVPDGHRPGIGAFRDPGNVEMVFRVRC